MKTVYLRPTFGGIVGTGGSFTNNITGSTENIIESKETIINSTEGFISPTETI